MFIAYDEGIPPPNFYDALPLYLENGDVVEPQYKFMFEVPSLGIQYKLLEFPNEEQLSDIANSIDIRYNATKGIIETDYNYWSGEETYYEMGYYYSIDLDRKVIILINNDVYQEECNRRIKINNKSLSWDEKNELRKNIVKSNIDNDKMIYTLDFTLTKI